MPNMQERLNTAVDMAEIDTELLHEVIHGSVTTDVDTEGGKVSSVAKAINDIRKNIQNGTNDLVSQAQTAAETATQQASRSEKAATQAENYSTQSSKFAETAKIWTEGTDAEVITLGGTHSCREWVELAEKATRGNYPIIISGIAEDGQDILPLTDTLVSPNQILSVNIENVTLLPEDFSLTAEKNAIRLCYPLNSNERWAIIFLAEFQSIGVLPNLIFYENMAEETE